MLILTSIPKLQSPVDHILRIDKLAHTFVYLVFAWLFLKMYEEDQFRIAMKKLLMLAAVVPLLDELHQIPIPGRSFSVWDIVADLIGFGIIILIFKTKIRIKNPA